MILRKSRGIAGLGLKRKFVLWAESGGRSLTRDSRGGIRFDVRREGKPEYEVGFTACWSLAWGR